MPRAEEVILCAIAPEASRNDCGFVDWFWYNAWELKLAVQAGCFEVKAF